MIDIQHVSYAYDSKTVLRDICLKEEEPAITGLWGRNGAGKTTLMKLLAGLNRPDQGVIRVMGKPPYNNLEAQRHICYIQEDHPFHPGWDARDVMRLGAYFNPNWSQKTADRLVRVFELPTTVKIKKFSKGMKTAIQIVLGLSSYSDVTIIDEPTNGLDAVIRKRFYEEVLDSFDAHPRILLFSSHHIEEMQPLCDKLVAIHRQTIMFHEPMEELRGRGIIVSGDKERLEALTAEMNVIEKKVMGRTMKVMIDDRYTDKWAEWAHAHQLHIDKSTLQDYLVNIAGEKKEEIRV